MELTPTHWELKKCPFFCSVLIQRLNISTGQGVLAVLIKTECPLVEVSLYTQVELGMT